MFSIAEIQEGPELKNISMFKAWWDILLDYLVAATALNVLLLLTRMASVDTGGLICVHPLPDKSFGYVESRYINSRCCSESQAWIVIFHPYLMLFMWMCITACHVCWIKIPSVNTKMEAFYAILYKIFTIQPKFYRNPKSLQMTTELSYNEANQKAIDVLLNKLLYLMTERPFLRGSYMTKHALVVILSIISVVYALFVIIFLSKYPSSFNCRLKHQPPTMRGYPFQNDTLVNIPCHLNIAPFIYVLIHVDSFIRIVMIGLSLKGLAWAYMGQKRLKRIKYRHFENEVSGGDETIRTLPPKVSKEEENPFGEAAEYLSGMPSYPDLLFCIKLLKRNVHDGHLMYQAICTSIKNYVKKLKSFGEKYKKRVQNERMGPVAKAATTGKTEYQPQSYHEYIAYVRGMAHELGLEEVPNSLNSNNLFEALAFIKNSLCVADISIETDLRHVIVKHIRSHPELYKTLIDDDPDFDTYEAHCEHLAKPTTFGSHYAIYAAATLFNIKIVLIHCEYTMKLPEVYVPLRHSLLLTGNIKSIVNAENLRGTLSTIPTRFLTYVAPHFYHATIDSPISPDWPHIVSRRNNYCMDRKFRRDLRQTTLRSVILSAQGVTKEEHP
ncbi:hypothetical protein RF11_07293 [Thelohanellus kitauei]|uniref:LRRC8 pannexin-like TM region domain-containing protein n=1 Tax=Thelohanellus kitauei TaxID=669202 RepID=A0A0C2MR42_THEKT|nr:hypothetical protein RF11_07293 [Thelohanellus kitauei]